MYLSQLEILGFKSFPEKTTLVSRKNVEITSLENGQKSTLKIETPVVIISNNNNQTVLQIVDGPDAGKQFQLNNASELNTSFENIEDLKNGQIQDAANEVGLNDDGMENNENKNPTVNEDFPVIEK